MDQRRWSDRESLGALALYALLSILFFGRALIGHFRSAHIGTGPDPSQFMWFLAWWPHAIANRLNPFLTRLLWVPAGFNLAWAICMPLVSVALTPITFWLGPVAAFNLGCLLAPALNAWMAFLLCRRLAGEGQAAPLGGYIFGFSPFVLGHELCGHLGVVMVFLIPLAVYLILLRLSEEIGAWTFAISFTLILVGQFLIFLEVFATMTLFGAVAMGLAIVLITGQTRARLLRLIAPIACCYAAALLIVSPYLYFFFAYGFSPTPLWPSDFFSLDLLNFVIPTRTIELGRFAVLQPLTGRFPGDSLSEATGYAGLPLILIAIAFTRRRWREPAARVLVDLLLITSIFSLGPRLTVAGHETVVALPWAAFFLPPLNNALPGRLSMYVMLALAIMTSMWLGDRKRRPLLRIVASIAVIAFLLPNLNSAFWTTQAYSPEFFSRGIYRKLLSRDDIVVTLPYGKQSDNAMLWQAESRMYFRMAGGYTGTIPEAYSPWPVVRALERGSYLPDQRTQFMAFAAAHHVNAVIVGDRDLPEWQRLLSTLGVVSVRSGGVSLYRLSPAVLAPYEKLPALALEQEAAALRIEAGVDAARKYLVRGEPLAALSAARAGEQGLLPSGWLVGSQNPLSWLIDPNESDFASPLEPYFHCDIWLKGMDHGEVSVGVAGSDAILAPIIESYHAEAKRIMMPYPRVWSGRRDVCDRCLIVFVFDRAGLQQAAGVAASRVQVTGALGARRD